jgi:RNA polymerase sigma factor (TIGR02999 family)
MPEAPRDVTLLLGQLAGGKADVVDSLLPLVYDALKAIARRQLRRERADHTLNATALVHEAYLKLVDQRKAAWQNRAHFFAIASQAMRRILVNYAHRRLAGKRGGGAQKYGSAMMSVVASGIPMPAALSRYTLQPVVTVCPGST